MDSNLLEQIRHLCRDRAAYEHLKAILVQQERVHQLSWEERSEKLIAVPSSDPQPADMFSHIIAREKALAQLADAIQRSPSLELVLQIAVQVAQKLLQVDRVAIFRCHPDGRGEFAMDAIATGLISIADMPEKQLSLARHMIESTDPEHSAQTIDSIRTSSLSSHIVTLLEQIGISSYAANKIYAGQEVWGTLVAFHGGAYHTWSESDRISLSLISAQIGIAISLTNLRQQSQELTDDLQTLQIELENLQQVVTEIAESKTNSTIPPDPTHPSTEQITVPDNEEIITDKINQDVGEGGQQDNFVSNDLKTEDGEASQVEQDGEDKESEVGEVIHKEEITYLRSVPIFHNGLPPFFLVSDSNADLLELKSTVESKNVESLENVTPEVLVIDLTQANIYYTVIPDDQKSLSDLESALKEGGLGKVIIAEIDSSLKDPSNQNLSEMELDEPESPNLEKSELENPDISEILESARSEPENPEPEIIDSSSSTSEDLKPEDSQLKESAQESISANGSETEIPETENSEPEIINSQSSQLESLEPEDLELEETSEQEAIAPESEELKILESKLLEMELSNSSELELIESAPIAPEIKLVSPEFAQQETIEAEINEIENQSVVEQSDHAQIDLDTTLALEEEHDDEEPAIEPQFMKTILDIAGNDLKATKFLLEVIDTYLEDVPRLVQTIDKAIAISDHVRLLGALNALRSSSDYIGALTLSHQCRQLESAVKVNYVVLIYACLSRLAIEAQRATDALRIARSRYKL